MAAVLGRLAPRHPVLVWQQGVLGPAAVAAGATGYESGIGWRERCDLPGTAAQHRKANPGGAARPVYITTLQRSMPKPSLRALHGNPRLIAELTCLDPSCCPNGRRDLLNDMRAHAITSRLAALRDLTAPAQPAWRWHHLARLAREGIDLAHSINTYAASTRGVSHINLAALQATLNLADHRRQTLRRLAAA